MLLFLFKYIYLNINKYIYLIINLFFKLNFLIIYNNRHILKINKIINIIYINYLTQNNIYIINIKQSEIKIILNQYYTYMQKTFNCFYSHHHFHLYYYYYSDHLNLHFFLHFLPLILHFFHYSFFVCFLLHYLNLEELYLYYHF